jgi:DUF1365 family protein
VNSCLYEGTVSHHRLLPVRHAFRYRLFMVYLDLDERGDVFRGRWLWSADRPALAWFRRRDHVGDPEVPLTQSVGDIVERQTGRRPVGPIRLLTNLRYFGFCFNPVSFYFCFDPGSAYVETIVAEVHNTPWGETHCYVLDAASRDAHERATLRFTHGKAFHVSPFMRMDQQYSWQVTEPGARLAVAIDSHEGGRKMFDSTLVLHRLEISGRTLARMLGRYPLLTARVVAAIYWQALRLWLKRVPVFAHPRCRTTLGAPEA